ncbi:hypothetical protein LguiB_033768 [Lonicera macranthoides]
MKKKINFILNKCKSLSRRLGRSTSSNSSRFGPSTEEFNWEFDQMREKRYWQEIVFVGSTRRQYVISSKYLSHPLLSALLEKEYSNGDLYVRCEVVLFDHLLWMLDNAEDELSTESFPELAQFYVM